MSILTKENLDLNLYPYSDYATIQRGRAYFQEGRVTITSFDGETAACRVRGDQGNYTVVISAETSRRITTLCDCPQAARARTCKHMVACLLALRKYLEVTATDQWQYRLKVALENTPRRKTSSGAAKYAVVFGLLREDYAGSVSTFRLIPFRIRLQRWSQGAELAKLPSQAEQNAVLDEDRSWVRAAETVYTALNYRSVSNLPMEAVQLFNMMTKFSSYYYGLTEFASYLPIMAKIDVPVFRMASEHSFKERLRLLTEPVRVEAALAREGDHYTLQAGLILNGETFTTIKESLHVLSTDPAWVLAGRYILPVENPEALTFLSFFPLEIPAKDEREFREKYLHPIAERVPIQGDVVSWEDVNSEPVPRLYLSDEAGALRATLRFGYGEHEVDADLKAEPVTIRDLPGSWGMVRIHRRLEAEISHAQMLAGARYGLKRGANLPAGTFELRARTHPLDFLLHSIPLLTRAGFEIFGEENLKSARLNRHQPTISLHISSGIDWFDVQAVVRYGDQEVMLKDIRQALRKKERYIKLADGSIGQIPEEWVERYKKLFDLAAETETGLRVRDFHLPLVDSLLTDASESQVASEFQARRERLRRFQNMQPQPLPQGFTGQLRPYQKASLDWLHFLHDYGFGGCLADDMGLGKTIELLAFLQSLKEQGKREAASLLVVPKSLIANWLREADRFTPELRILEYVGIARPKSTPVFDAYDVVLTTYGTMLRDIEFLRGYNFLYTVLDESQNIKNPLAQSSKAARLLNAKHRLVLTGTPVENNTFDLWSQFAFLNPGLLGSMDYFKREFVTPIESRASEDTAQLLRRLIYPFVLRRTKEQVAPELPARTERILYTDLESPQRKLYNTTRDYYRGLLMGVIDERGIDDARMQILEGLLRLRQICIHPQLVQPGYRGGSAKFELLLESLETLRAEGHKALVYSQFVQTLHLLQKELDARQIPYTYLDGKTGDRQKQVDIFQNDPGIPFFLISLKAGGVGLNLTAADYVIHVDPWWNPAVEMQAADRAHRIGQDKPVFVYKIIARNSVEEKILQLQERKRDLVGRLISTEGSFFKSITKEDVQGLFS